ncbi:MAG: molecular chaperone TorD family protein [Pseudomonadota bacterium]|nr:molecular chaperone TorD family protein [Pseudomonadota bacterium]
MQDVQILFPLLSPEDRIRAMTWDLLADLLHAPPDAAILEEIGTLEGDSTDMGRAIRLLAQAARRTTAAQAAAEYELLFGGAACRVPEVPSIASSFRGVFRDTHPALRLNTDLLLLGLAPEQDSELPPDHIASLCRTMSALICNASRKGIDSRDQDDFFQIHLAAWAHDFFRQLESARGAIFYMPVGTLGRRFLAVEGHVLAMAA